MHWQLSSRQDAAALPLADRHYNRQKPGTDRFGPPGRSLALITPCRRALWLTTWQQHVQHAWPGAWVCSLFRNEGAALSSVLIREAVAVTRWHFGAPPQHGMITFVDTAKVRRKRDPGRCYLRAGFVRVGWTSERGFLVLQLQAEAMPPAEAPLGVTLGLVI